MLTLIRIGMWRKKFETLTEARQEILIHTCTQCLADDKSVSIYDPSKVNVNDIDALMRTPCGSEFEIEFEMDSKMWAVYLEDTNGTRRIVGKNIDLSKEEAEQAIADILANHTKPHKVDYYMIEYTLENKLQTFSDHRINI